MYPTTDANVVQRYLCRSCSLETLQFIEGEWGICILTRFFCNVTNKDYTMSKTITKYHISYIVCFHFDFVFCMYENLDLKIVFVGLNPIAIVYIILWMHRIYSAS